jgi:hypothetical protein
MEHKNRWRTCLNLMRLEDRSQPGTLLTSGIDVGALAGVIDPPKQRESTHIIKRFDTSEDIHSVSPLSESANTIIATSVTTIQKNETPAQAVQKTAPNPVLFQPASKGDRFLTHRGIDTQGQGPRIRLGTPTLVPFTGQHVTGSGKLSRLPGTDVDQGSDSGSGTRALNFVNYDTPGTPRADVVNDVAAGAGAHAGDVYVAGQQARSGTVKRYGPTGALEATTAFIPNGGMRAQITGIAVSADGSTVYVTGRENVGSSSTAFVNFVHAIPAALGGGVQPIDRLHNYPAGGPGDVENLEDIAVSGFDGDIVVTGSVEFGGYSTPAHFRYAADAGMSVVIEQSVDFGEDADGYSIVVDTATGFQVFGGDVDTAGINDGLNFVIEDDNIFIPYAFADSCDGALGTTADPNNGEWGEVIVGTSLFLSGSLADETLNPTEPGDPGPYDNMYIAEVNLADGAILGYYTCLTIGGPAVDGVGGDYASRGSAAAGGAHLVAGYADFEGTAGSSQSIHRAHHTELSATGTVVSSRTYGDSGTGALFDRTTEARGIAVLSTGEVATGGITNTPSTTFTPAMTAGNDTTFGTGGQPDGGPPSDGYYASDDLPFGG